MLVAGVVAAGWVAFIAVFVPSGVGSAATVGDSASATVTLDSPGSVTLDAFDPALGTLTSVEVSLIVDVLVQVCVENWDGAAGSLAGSISGSLAAEFPGGAGAAAAAADEPVPATPLGASNGAADCANGYDAATGRFPAAVSAADTVFFQDANQATGGALTDASTMAPFVGTGTVTGVFTPTSDTDLDPPADFESLAVAQGQLQASVTYTYTPGGPGDHRPSR